MVYDREKKVDKDAVYFKTILGPTSVNHISNAPKDAILRFWKIGPTMCYMSDIYIVIPRKCGPQK